MKQLCEALIVNPSLCSLDLRSNHIDHTGAAHLANMIQLNSSLQELGACMCVCVWGGGGEMGIRMGRRGWVWGKWNWEVGGRKGM